MNTLPDLQQPAWHNSTEYESINDPKFKADYEEVSRLTIEIESLAKDLRRLDDAILMSTDQGVHSVAQALQTWDQATILNANCMTFVRCQGDLDGRAEEPKQWQTRLTVKAQNIRIAFAPVRLCIQSMTPAVFEILMTMPGMQVYRFRLSKIREQAAETLTEREETLILRLSNAGMEGWSNLYNDLASTTQVLVEDPEDGFSATLGLAAAANLLSNPQESRRKAASLAIKQVMASQENTYCSALNALADWRLQVIRTRSDKSGQPIHFLDPSLFAARISRQTLDAMMIVLQDNRQRVQKALQWKASQLGKQQLEYWDLSAPCPAPLKGFSQIPFPQAVEKIQEAFHNVDPSMADFVAMMVKNHWIDARVMPTKRPGAYCTKFQKSRSPRVFISYGGSFAGMKTLAHELGHAFHSWVMRDLHFAEIGYPMTLAETASIFCESVLTGAIENSSNEPAFKDFTRWTYAGLAEVFLLNIPLRFEFENQLYEARKEGLLSPKDLCKMMKGSGRKWYGDSVKEFDEYFWASKMHFYMSKTSFYNYPYTFGFLFAQGILAMRQPATGNVIADKAEKQRFFKRYTELLRDTGRMKAEELAQKHLGVDLTAPAFWQRGVDQVLAKLDL